MRVLITAGGTRVPVDDVRWLGNAASGRFGVALARAARRRGARVALFAARDVPDPRCVVVPPAELPRAADWLPEQLERARALAGAGMTRLTATRFTSFDDYWQGLRRLLTRGRFDVAFLAAAVSDFAPEPQAGKATSAGPAPALALRPLPKAIDHAKRWAPGTFLVGFKLRSGGTRDELLAAARAGQRRHGAELVVANDWQERRRGRYPLHLVAPAGPPETLGPADETALAAALFDRVAARWQATRTEGR